MLNTDGSLNLPAGFRGSLDASGWQMSPAPDGQPRFTRAPAAPALAGAEFWDSRLVNRLTDPGFAVHAYAVAVLGSDVYVGGNFTHAGGVVANNIARYSMATHQWYPLAGGINGTVYTLVVSGNSIYAGGSFNDVMGQSAWSLARWDTSAQTWSVIGGFPGVESGG
jgi:hypothetical protein